MCLRTNPKKNIVCPLMDEDKRLVQASWWEGQAVGKTESCFDGQGLLSKSLIQFSANGWACVPSLLVVGPEAAQSKPLQSKYLCQHSASPRTTAASAPVPAASHCWPRPLQKTLKHSQASLVQSLWGRLLLFPWVLVAHKICLWHPRVSGAFPTVSPLSLDMGYLFFGGLQDECISLYSSIFYKPLTLIHQRVDRKSKNYNPMASRTKITITEN